ncbi:DUF2252 family protein [Candidatus Gracilibacteria bacterium]|nr:DUF2252 family protein [Candidatus Gracilibacteria bacterium]
MAEDPKLEQAPSPTQQPGSTEALSSLIEKSRQDKRFDHAELDQVLAKYEAEKNNLNEQFSVKIGEEKSKADALLADSFEDVFEEYKVTSKADFDRVQRLLNIINPIRAERGQVMVFFSADTKAYFESPQSSDKNITFDKETGQLRLQSWYRGFFTREGSAKVETESKTLDQKEVALLEKMEKSPNSFLRGSVNDYYAFLSEGIEKNPDLEKLSDLKVLSTGDLHLEQLEFIEGKAQISDIDDAIKDGNPTTDIIRAISSIRLLSSSPEKADANVQVFLDTLQASLEGANQTSGQVPESMNKTQTYEQFIQIDPIKFNSQTQKFDLNSEKEKSVSTEKINQLKTVLDLDILDAKSAVGNGIGSFGKEKITIAYRVGNDVKFQELKEQDQDSSFDTLLNHHDNSERALVANELGVAIKSVEIDGKPYTMKELTPGYAQFKPGDNGENVEFGSRELAVQLGKLLSSDPETASKVLAELKKPEVQNSLGKVGKEYADRISGALTTARSEYPELAPSPKLPEPTSQESTIPSPPTLAEGGVNSREVTDADITNLENFYKKYPKGIPQFHREIRKNPEALSVLKKILELPDTASIQEVHKKTYTIQKTLGVTSDGAFGPRSFEKWKQDRRANQASPSNT